MLNTTTVRAGFVGCNIKRGKTVMQFELDPECKSALPQLAVLTGTVLTLDLTGDQTVLFVDKSSGEVIEGEDGDGAREECRMFELPPAACEYEEAEGGEAA
ncbi:hypothetical protein GMI70_07040 [Eggerthellaceae bacterium zg-893]|nr:hypothetical protein [Eggerthellaceae bacterium zg-893]